MFNRPGVTYESAQTRKFQLGRTEVIRSASNESGAWARAMLDPTVTVRPITIPSLFLSIFTYFSFISLGPCIPPLPIHPRRCASHPVRQLGRRRPRRRSAPLRAEEAAQGRRVRSRDLH